MFWMKKHKEEAQEKQKQKNERDLFRAILDSLTALEKRMNSAEIEIDSLKIRFRKKLIPEEKKEDLYKGVLLPE